MKNIHGFRTIQKPGRFMERLDEALIFCSSKKRSVSIHDKDLTLRQLKESLRVWVPFAPFTKPCGVAAAPGLRWSFGSREQCRRRCELDPLCGALAFEANSSKCILYASPDAPPKCKVDSCETTTAFSWLYRCGGPRCREKFGRERPGALEGPPLAVGFADSPAQCRASCCLWDLCHGWSFSLNSSYCHLTHKAAGFRPRAGYLSSVKSSVPLSLNNQGTIQHNFTIYFMNLDASVRKRAFMEFVFQKTKCPYPFSRHRAELLPLQMGTPNLHKLFTEMHPFLSAAGFDGSLYEGLVEGGRDARSRGLLGQFVSVTRLLQRVLDEGPASPYIIQFEDNFEVPAWTWLLLELFVADIKHIPWDAIRFDPSNKDLCQSDASKQVFISNRAVKLFLCKSESSEGGTQFVMYRRSSISKILDFLTKTPVNSVDKALADSEYASRFGVNSFVSVSDPGIVRTNYALHSDIKRSGAEKSSFTLNETSNE